MVIKHIKNGEDHDKALREVELLAGEGYPGW